MPDPIAEAEEQRGMSGRPWVRRLAYLIGAAMLGASIWVAIAGAGGGGQGVSGWSHLGQADPLHIAGMLGLVAANILINGFLFWILVKPFEQAEPVGLVDMIALIGATALLNYLPMRAGMIGRAAYLKNRHEIGYRTSAVMLIAAAACTVITFVLVILLTFWRGSVDAIWLIVFLVGLAVCAGVGLIALRIALPRVPGVPETWFTRRSMLQPSMLAMGWIFLAGRGLDVFCYAARLWLAARVLGWGLDFSAALVLATGGMLVMLATPLPNGLGAREWMYGWLAKMGVGGQALDGLRAGLTLGLLDRAAEAIVFITLGLISIAYLHRRGFSVRAREAE